MRARDEREQPRSVRVMTVDDQPLFRDAARMVLSATPGFEPIAEVESAEEALDAIDRVCPRLLLLDVRMPGMGGVEAARQITTTHPEMVVFLVSADVSVRASDVEACGASAFLRKEDFGSRTLRELWALHAPGEHR